MFKNEIPKFSEIVEKWDKINEEFNSSNPNFNIRTTNTGYNLEYNPTNTTSQTQGQKVDPFIEIPKLVEDLKQICKYPVHDLGVKSSDYMSDYVTVMFDEKEFNKRNKVLSLAYVVDTKSNMGQKKGLCLEYDNKTIKYFDAPYNAREIYNFIKNMVEEYPLNPQKFFKTPTVSASVRQEIYKLTQDLDSMLDGGAEFVDYPSTHNSIFSIFLDPDDFNCDIGLTYHIETDMLIASFEDGESHKFERPYNAREIYKVLKGYTCDE